MIDFKNLHVGLTNRCALACPECPRSADWKEYIYSMVDADVSLFKQFLSNPEIESILFCGNWGDPIYARDFLGLIQHIRQANPKCYIRIHTNGAFKPVQWWRNLTEALDDRYQLVFSIDGIPSNYTTYRRNSSWDSVKTAVETVLKYRNSKAKWASIEWKYIVFSYNEHDIISAFELSQDLGFDKFRVVRALITEDPTLEPSRPFEEIRREFLDRYPQDHPALQD